MPANSTRDTKPTAPAILERARQASAPQKRWNTIHDGKRHKRVWTNIDRCRLRQPTDPPETAQAMPEPQIEEDA